MLIPENSAHKVKKVDLFSINYGPDGLCIDYLLIILLLMYTEINNSTVFALQRQTESKEEGDSEEV